MQVLFHSSIEADAGRFNLDDVADQAVKKLIFRHPHVFGAVEVENSDQVLVNWDQLKRQEKHQETYTDTLNAVARSLPALWRAEKVQKKAAVLTLSGRTCPTTWTSSGKRQTRWRPL